MNILLLGMPGSGKTKIGKILARRLDCDFIDIDEFIFEQTGKDSAEHLAELGDDEFLKFESKLVQKIETENAIIATSGSVPLVEAGIEHLKKNSFAIWLQPSFKIIEKRIAKRRGGSSRIVGMQTRTLSEIWKWREKAYAKHHHAIVTIKEETPTEEIVDQILEILQKNATN